MSLSVIFLGTGAAVPTIKRSLPAVMLQLDKEQLMFDCGEGTQRQMMQAKLGFQKKLSIFITHLHGDHVLGLPGLLQTMALMNRQKMVRVYGPVGLARFLSCTQESLQFGLTFEVEIHEISAAGVVCDDEEYTVEAYPSNHAVPSFAYAFVEKPRPGRFHPENAKAIGVPKGEAWGKLQRGETYVFPDGKVVKPQDVADAPRNGRKFVYTGDTKPFAGFAEFAANADLLVHEATFDDALAEKAETDTHSTPSQAATQAKKASAKLLVLTHLSARYTDTTLLLNQAKKVFPYTLIAEDLMQLNLQLSE